MQTTAASSDFTLWKWHLFVSVGSLWASSWALFLFSISGARSGEYLCLGWEAQDHLIQGAANFLPDGGLEFLLHFLFVEEAAVDKGGVSHLEADIEVKMVAIGEGTQKSDQFGWPQLINLANGCNRSHAGTMLQR
eukprot:15366679-Ditylum_brightwellii.AAC.1